MRRNAFGEAYCHTADEVRKIVDERGDQVYCPQIDEPSSAEDMATGEVCENVSGDTVCWIEAPTVEDVRKIAREADVELQ